MTSKRIYVDTHHKIRTHVTLYQIPIGEIVCRYASAKLSSMYTKLHATMYAFFGAVYSSLSSVYWFRLNRKYSIVGRAVNFYLPPLAMSLCRVRPFRPFRMYRLVLFNPSCVLLVACSVIWHVFLLSVEFYCSK